MQNVHGEEGYGCLYSIVMLRCGYRQGEIPQSVEVTPKTSESLQQALEGAEIFGEAFVA